MTRQRSSSAPPRPRPPYVTAPAWSEAHNGSRHRPVHSKHRARTPPKDRARRRKSPRPRSSSPRPQQRSRTAIDKGEATEGVPPRRPRRVGTQDHSAVKEVPLRLATLFAGDCAYTVAVDSVGYMLTYVFLVALSLYAIHVRHDLDPELLKGCCQQFFSGQQKRRRKRDAMLHSTWREWWGQRRDGFWQGTKEWFVVVLVYLLLRAQVRSA